MPIEIPKKAFESFLEYISESCVTRFYEGQTLADYIDEWLRQDSVDINACFGKFEIFLKAVVLIVDEWHRNPEILDCHGFPSQGIPAFRRRPTSAFGNEGLHKIFDVDNFDAAVFLWTHIEPDNRLRKLAHG